MIALFAAVALAETPPELRDDVVPQDDTPEGGLTFLGLVQSRATVTSVETTSPYLDGQVIGALGGTNGTVVTGENLATTAELRTNGFFTYAPKLLNGRASLTAGFEIDYTFGDQSYLSGGNTGGAFGADQVNLQTRRLHATFRPKLGGGHDLSLVLGLQFVGDGVYDPTRSRPDDLFRTGGGLRVFGSEAAGLTAYGKWSDAWGERLRWRLGGYTLYEKGSALSDDVTLAVADAQIIPTYGTRIGFHAWWIRDLSGGTGGLLGTGPSSALSELQGGPRLSFGDQPVNTDARWIAVDAGWNHALDRGPVALNGLFVADISHFYIEDLQDDSGIGMLLGGEARWRWAEGDGSVVRAEAMWASDDSEHVRGYGGMLTGNSWGIVGAMWATHGTLLLFPDPNAINRQVAVVYDVSNGGRGLGAVVVEAGWDAVPNRVNVAVVGATAADGAGNGLGTELDLKLRVRPYPLMNVGLAGGAVLGSGFPATPWTAFASLDWVVF